MAPVHDVTLGIIFGLIVVKLQRSPMFELVPAAQVVSLDTSNFPTHIPVSSSSLSLMLSSFLSHQKAG